MTEEPAYPKWHWMITMLCVATGLLLAYIRIRWYGAQPDGLSSAAPGREVMFQNALLVLLTPEAVHQFTRLLIWSGRCEAAARRLRVRAPDRQRLRTWLTRVPVPYPWRFWQITYASVSFGLFVAFWVDGDFMSRNDVEAGHISMLLSVAPG